MSSALENNQEYLDRLEGLNLTKDEASELIAALQSIADSLLDKKYMLGLDDDETERKNK